MLQRIEMDNRNRAIIAEAIGEAPMSFMKSEPKPDPAVFVTGLPAAVSAPPEAAASVSLVKHEVTPAAAPTVEEEVEEEEAMFCVNGVMKRFSDITEDDQGMMSQEEFKVMHCQRCVFDVVIDFI